MRRVLGSIPGDARIAYGACHNRYPVTEMVTCLIICAAAHCSTVTASHLNSLDVIRFDDLPIWAGRLIERRHECGVHLAVQQAQTVSELVRRHREQVQPIPVVGRVHDELLALVKVRVAAVDREEGVSQRAAWTIERVPVAVVTVFEPAAST